MQVTLTIIRYKPWYIPFAFIAMAIFRLPLYLNKEIQFYKLMGCGKNGTFDKIPDLQQWAILATHRLNKNINHQATSYNSIFGKFISGWFQFFNCETFTVFLDPIEGHGLWDKKKVFGEFSEKKEHEGPIATLTRATIRLSKMSYFWKHVAPVAEKMHSAKGYITSVGIGEIPWIKQATFSIWQSKEDMKAFAYGMKEHAEVIKKTRSQRWYSEDMFVRFVVKGSMGSMRGNNPLKGIV